MAREAGEGRGGERGEGRGRGEGKEGERRGREGREVDTPNFFLDRRLCKAEL